MNKKEYASQYYRRNKDKMLNNIKSHQRQNKDKYYETTLAWKERNHDRVVASVKRYNSSLQGKYRAYSHGASKRSIPFTLTLEEFETFWQKPCWYCHDPIPTIGIDRIDSSIGYQPDNIVPCCYRCNKTKNDLPQDQFLDLCRRIASLH